MLELADWLSTLDRSRFKSPMARSGSRYMFLPPKIIMATLYTAEIAAYGKYTSEVLRRYAAKHGYRTLIQLSTLDESRPPSWSKIRLLERAFESKPRCQWVMWVDADALIVEHHMQLTEFLDDDADFIISDDSPHGLLCAGVFFARNCHAVKELLRRAYAKRQFIHDRLWEQLAIAETVRKGVPGLRVKIISRRKFNSFAEEYQAGDFIVHYAGRSHAERVRELRRRATLILHPPPRIFGQTPMIAIFSRRSIPTMNTACPTI